MTLSDSAPSRQASTATPELSRRGGAAAGPWVHLVAGVGLVGGAICSLVAALYPGMSSVWTASPETAVILIGDHRDAWLAANWMFAAGVVGTLTGLAGFTHLLAHRTGRSPLPTLAFTLAAIASTLWLANLAFRLTTTVSVADEIAGGATVPAWYRDISAWADNGLLCAFAIIGGVALTLYGAAIGASRVLPAWTGWFAALLGVGLLAQGTLSGDVIPALFYLAPLAAGLAALRGALGHRSAEPNGSTRVAQ